MRRKAIFLIITILAATPPLLFGSKPNVINFPRDTYRAANNNWSIGCDTLDIVYFGNDDGLLEFDGINWRLYPHPRVIRAVCVAPSGEIYTGGREEFGVWGRDASGGLVYSKLSDKLDYGSIRNNEIWQILFDKDDIYFQSFAKVFRLRDGNITEIAPAGGLLFMMKTRYGLFAQNINGPLMKLSGDEFEPVPGSEFLSGTEVEFILPFRNGEYIVGTSSSGLYIYNGKTFRQWESDFTSRAIRHRLNRGIRMDSGNYLFGTILNGVYEVSPEGQIKNHFSTDNFLQNNTILSLMEDASGNAWVATDRGISYIAYFPGMDFHVDPQGRVGTVYTAAVFAGKLFVGTNQGVYHMPVEMLAERESVGYLSILEGTQGQVWDLEVYDGQLLCGHNSGLMVIDEKLRVKSVKDVQVGVTDICVAMHKGRDYIMLGTYRSLAVLDSDFKPIPDLYDIHEPISSIYVDAMDDIWLCQADKGVYRFRFDDNGRGIRYRESYGGMAASGAKVPASFKAPSGSKSTSGVEDEVRLPESLKLFGIDGRAVFYGDDTFYIYDYVSNQIVPHDTLNDYFKDIKSIRKIIELSHSRYLALSDKAAYTFVTEDRRITIINRSPVEMTNISLVNRDENAVALSDKYCLICLDNGFILKNTALAVDARPISKPYLRSVSAEANKHERRNLQTNRGRLKIDYKYNTVDFDFSVFGALAQNLTIQYRLKHLENEWSEPERVSKAHFPRLPQGDYTFMLRATDGLGNFSEVASFPFTIRPPWYLSWWAFAIYAMMLMCGAYLGWLVVRRRYRRAIHLRYRMMEEQRLKDQNFDLQVELRHKDAELFSQTSFIMQKNELIQQIKGEMDELDTQYKANALLRQAFMRINTMLDRNLNAENDWKVFLMQFERTNSGFFKRLKELSPDLTPGDLKTAACLRLNLNSKDIASLLNISIRAVENNRHRLRKKLDIPQNTHLNDFFIEL